MRILRVLSELLGQLFDLSRQLRDEFDQLRELGVALRERILEPRDASLPLLPLCVRVLASHGKLRSRSERAVDPRRDAQIGGVNGYAAIPSSEVE